MPSRDLCYLSIAEAARLIRGRRLSCAELTQAVLDRIGEGGPRLNAFITVMAEEALRDARAADRRLERADYAGPLHGIPVSVKDLFDARGVRTTAASKILAGRVARRDSAVVQRLRQAGAIVAGKANMSEFAIGGMQPEYGPVRNPWDPARAPGGSSSGSGAGVATGMGFASIGSDTGGSIRIPSAFCGIVGLKPTYGRVSRRGMVALSWTLDHAGPMTRTVRDAAIVLQAIAGHDSEDPTSSTQPVPNYARALRRDLKGVRIGIPRAYYYDELDAEVASALDRAHGVLRRLGARLRDVTIPHAEVSLAALTLIMHPEGAALLWPALRERPGDFSDPVRGRFVQGLLTPASAYLKACRVRAKLIEEFRAAFEKADALVLPTVPIPPHRLDERPVTSSGVAVVGRNTGSFTLTGLPALSVPCGFTRAGLPMGVQIVGRPFDEATVLRIGHAYEQATDWHTRRPRG